jgi:hypothetical protein
MTDAKHNTLEKTGRSSLMIMKSDLPWNQQMLDENHSIKNIQDNVMFFAKIIVKCFEHHLVHESA